MSRDFKSSLLPALLLLLFVDGIAQMVNGGAAAFFRADFDLSEAELARLFAFLSLGAFGAMLLSRLMDRVGRRRMLLVNVAGSSLSALGIAVTPGLAMFIVFQIINIAFAGALIATVSTFLTEELDSEGRARGQAAAGFAVQLGSGAALIGVAAAVEFPGSWRWVFAFMALPVFSLPWLWRNAPETGRFAQSELLGETRTSSVAELFDRRYRTRTLGLVSAVLLATATVTVTMTWLLYHAETAHQLSPAIATAIVIAGGAVGLAGFPLGAHFANRVGRRWTILVFGGLLSVCNIGYYWVPRGPLLPTALALGLLFSLASIGYAAATVASRTAGPELFPTRLRGTVGGVLMATGATSGLAAHYATSVLAEGLGSFPLAITAVSAIGALGFVAYRVLLPETRGLLLEEAALETP